MNRPIRIALLVIFMVSFLILTPTKATQEGTWFTSQIEYAGYDNLDGDGRIDDIFTGFSIDVLEDAVPFETTYLYCTLLTPSGNSYDVVITVVGEYGFLHIDLHWYNVATESGWYTFQLTAEVVTQEDSYSTYTEMVFDPPTEGNPAPPLVEVTNITITE